MKALICGAGGITRELLRRMGESWTVTLISKSPEEVERCQTLFPELSRFIIEDPSSPVVLEEAGIEQMDYVLALTDSDKVNLAVARHARDKKLEHIIALLQSNEMQPAFRELGVHAVMANRLVGQNIHTYLQDPRITVTPISAGSGTIYEVNASHYFRIVGKSASYFAKNELRLAAIIRRQGLVFPNAKTKIRSGDRLVLIGKPELFSPVCDLLECSNAHFPLAYGQTLLVCLPWEGKMDQQEVLDEGLYISRNTQVKQVSILCPGSAAGVEEMCAGKWPQEVSVHFAPAETKGIGRIVEAARQQNCGLVVVPPFEESFLRSLIRPTLISLAHELDCPLLLSRNSMPYKKILVPFNGTPMAEKALEVAVDLGRQLRAELTVMSVVEPDFIKGAEEAAWTAKLRSRLKELAHVHKHPFEEILRRGNPVREIMDAAEAYDLMVLGSTVKEKSLLTPHVGEALARRSPCSVLILAS